MLKPAEAAIVAQVTLRDVNRAIDERILPDDFYSLDDGRRVAASGCTLIAFYVDSAQSLTAQARLSVINDAGERLRRLDASSLPSLVEEDWTVRDDFITIDLAPFIRRTTERMGRLAAARAMVATDPDVLGGTPVIRGTRIPVHDIAASVSAGLPVKRLLDAYPSLDADKIELATLYAEANPPRGRPRSADRLPEGATIIADRLVPRHATAG